MGQWTDGSIIFVELSSLQKLCHKSIILKYLMNKNIGLYNITKYSYESQMFVICGDIKQQKYATKALTRFCRLKML